MSNLPRLDGLQLIHAHNRTLAVREGHMSIDCANSIRILYADTSNVSYIAFNELEPGAYIANVNGTMLAFVLYEHITGPDELIIKSRNNIFSIHNLVKHKIIPYILNTDIDNTSRYGHRISRAVHDTLEVFSTTGYTEYVDSVNAYNPGRITMTDKLYVRTISGGRFEYSDINLMSPINSLSDNVRDHVYVDRYLNKTMYKFNVGRLILSGEEQWQELSDGIFYYPSTEPYEYGIVKSSHFKSIEYVDITRYSSPNYGICAGPADRRGFYIKTRPEEPQKLDEFKALLRDKFTNGDSIQVLYRLTKPIFRILPTGAKIQLPFKNGYMTTCTNTGNISNLTELDFVRNKYNIYFYNHLKGDDE